MKTLFQAIYAQYLSKPLASALTDLYNTEAPPEAIFPYGVFQLISDVAEGTYTEDMENCLVQFNLYSDKSSCSDVCDHFELLKAAFDEVDLTITGYTPISMVREPSSLLKVEDVWQYNVTYRIVIQKN
jgi:hypothetical protein